jgi:hypothetical protein
MSTRRNSNSLLVVSIACFCGHILFGPNINKIPVKIMTIKNKKGVEYILMHESFKWDNLKIMIRFFGQYRPIILFDNEFIYRCILTECDG